MDRREVLGGLLGLPFLGGKSNEDEVIRRKEKSLVYVGGNELKYTDNCPTNFRLNFKPFTNQYTASVLGIYVPPYKLFCSSEENMDMDMYFNTKIERDCINVLHSHLNVFDICKANIDIFCGLNIFNKKSTTYGSRNGQVYGIAYDVQLFIAPLNK